MESTKQDHKFLKVVAVGLFFFVGTFSAGQAHAASGELWATGYNDYGQLGLGFTPVYADPPGWLANSTVVSLTQVVGTWASIDEAFMNTAGIKTDGTLWTWGLNTYCTGSGTPGQVICASDLGLYASQLCPWVNGTSFAFLCLPPLDAATGSGVSSPTRVGSDSNWASVTHTASPIDTTFAIKTDGTLWCWGYNSGGTCGLGYTSFNVDFPTQVQPGTTWRIIRGGYYHVMGIKTDGTLWAWNGPDGYGALGLGADYQPVAYYSTPHQVGSDSDWADVQAGYHSTVALKTNGTLWAWGSNTFGQLGLGVDYQPAVPYSTPQQVGSDSNWASVSMRSNESAAAIKTDGTLWAWGMNVYGNLGLGTGGTYYGHPSPTRVGTDSNWASVSVGNFPYEYTAAVKTDGTLWAWGSNAFGQLGLGDRTDRYSPTQVGSRTDWGSVSAGSYATMAITGVPAACTATTNSNCSLPETASGSSAGSCGSGYFGSCNYLCTNGVWTQNSNSCTPAACTLPWGGTIVSGVSVQAFQVPSVISPAACPASQTLTCMNGTLSGSSYQYSNCVVLQPSATISANPTRVRSTPPGNTSTISWTVTDTTCSIARSPSVSGWPKSNLSAPGSNTTDTITGQTIYTITCTGVTPQSITVNVLANFQEF